MHTLEAWHPGASPKWQHALSQLLEAAYYAHDLGRPVGDFAIPLETLRGAGLNDNDLCWLGRKKFVAGCESPRRWPSANNSPPTSRRRRARARRPLAERPQEDDARMVLTAPGLEFAL